MTTRFFYHFSPSFSLSIYANLVAREHKQGLPIAEKWKYQDSITIQIPRLEQMPTVINGSLISIKYCLAIHLAARGN